MCCLGIIENRTAGVQCNPKRYGKFNNRSGSGAYHYFI